MFIDPNHAFDGILSESYTSTQSWLKNYLSNSDIDPYWWSHLLDEWVDDRGLNIDPTKVWDQIDNLTEDQLKDFTEWLKERVDLEARDNPVDDQPNRNMEYQYLVKPLEWLVHFSDDAHSIALEGFQYGSELRGLHYTKGKEKEKHGEFAFAYYADSGYAVNAVTHNYYGRHAVLFRTNAGVYVYHYGDQDEQIIFDKSTARDRIYLHRDGDSWFIEDVVTGRKLIEAEFEKVVAWVEKNFNQYRNRLVSP